MLKCAAQHERTFNALAFGIRKEATMLEFVGILVLKSSSFKVVIQSGNYRY